MKSYIGRLGNLGVKFPKELAVGTILNLLSSSYHQLVRNYNMINLDKNLMELHGLLKSVKASLIKNKSSKHTTPVLVIGHGGANKKKKFPHGKRKAKIGSFNQGLNRKVDSRRMVTGERSLKM